MLTRFDHAVIGVRDLDRTTTIWRDLLGFDVQPGGRHTGRGTYNALVRFGLDYIELISIYSREEVQGRGEGNALALARLLDTAGSGMLGFALATDDIEAEAQRLRSAGLEATGPLAMERMRPDGRVLKWRLLVPRGTSWGRWWPFLIQWDAPDDERLGWERPGTHPNGTHAVAGLAVIVPDLPAGVDLYQRQLGLTPIGQDAVAGIGARRASFQIGETRIDLLAPAAPGPITDAVNAGVECPWQITLAVQDLEASRHYLAARRMTLWPAPGTAGGMLIRPMESEEQPETVDSGTPAEAVLRAPEETLLNRIVLVEQQR